MMDEYPEISGITNAREAMKKMPEPDRARIAEQVGLKPSYTLNEQCYRL